jgi:acetyl-CoA carboxylase carboxyl transferase subunit beta
MNPFFEKQREKILNLKALREGSAPAGPSGRREVQPAGITCPSCGHVSTAEELSRQERVCRCGHHYPMTAAQRIGQILDDGSFREIARNVRPQDWLGFPGYSQKLAALKKETGLTEGVTAGRGRLGGHPVVFGVMDTRFLMGSMGTAVGERITQAIELAAKKKLPLILFCASGGARMQEGILSLMQMAKTSAALKRFSDKGGLYISVLTHPTTGGVTASFAMLGDIILAEPDALIGFAGPRVIAQTIGETLPEGFQRSAFQEAHGFVDAVVERRELRRTLIRLLRLHHAPGHQETKGGAAR